MLVSARLDATAMFHDVAAGANAAMSGLIVLLAAAEAYANGLRAAGAAGGAPGEAKATPAKRVAFAAFAAEDWGYAGSRRFLYELADRGGSNAGFGFGGANVGDVLGLGDVDAAIELGAIGLAHRRIPADVASPAVFVHAAPGFNSAGLANAIIESGAGVPGVSLRRSADGVPFPPSSTFSLLRRNPDGTTPAVLLAEYDDRYIDPFYGGAWDSGVDAVDPARMARVAVVLAKTLLTTAAGFPPGSAQLARATEGVVASDVDATTRELVTCLVDQTTGFDCRGAKALFSPATGRWSSRYAGVVPGLAKDFAQNPLGKSDVQRFAWNFLANATADRDLSSFKSCASQKECGKKRRRRSRWRGMRRRDRRSKRVSRPAGATSLETPAADRTGRAAGHRRFQRRRYESRGAGGVRRGGVGFVPALSHRLAFDATELIWRLGAADPTELALGGGEDPSGPRATGRDPWASRRTCTGSFGTGLFSSPDWPWRLGRGGTFGGSTGGSPTWNRRNGVEHRITGWTPARRRPRRERALVVHESYRRGELSWRRLSRRCQPRRYP